MRNFVKELLNPYGWVQPTCRVGVTTILGLLIVMPLFALGYDRLMSPPEISDPLHFYWGIVLPVAAIALVALIGCMVTAVLDHFSPTEIDRASILGLIIFGLAPYMSPGWMIARIQERGQSETTIRPL